MNIADTFAVTHSIALEIVSVLFVTHNFERVHARRYAPTPATPAFHIQPPLQMMAGYACLQLFSNSSNFACHYTYSQLVDA